MRRKIVYLGIGALFASVVAAGTAAATGGDNNGTTAATTSAAVSTPITGNCPVTRQSFASLSDGQATSDSSFVDMPGTRVRFTQGGTRKSCITVVFSGQGYAPEPALMVILPILGSTENQQVQLVGGQASWGEAGAFVFSFRGVSPGKHTVRIQWRSANGGTVSISFRTLVVYHQ